MSAPIARASDSVPISGHEYVCANGDLVTSFYPDEAIYNITTRCRANGSGHFIQSHLKGNDVWIGTTKSGSKGCITTCLNVCREYSADGCNRKRCSYHHAGIGRVMSNLPGQNPVDLGPVGHATSTHRALATKIIWSEDDENRQSAARKRALGVKRQKLMAARDKRLEIEADEKEAEDLDAELALEEADAARRRNERDARQRAPPPSAPRSITHEPDLAAPQPLIDATLDPNLFAPAPEAFNDPLPGGKPIEAALIAPWINVLDPAPPAVELAVANDVIPELFSTNEAIDGADPVLFDEALIAGLGDSSGSILALCEVNGDEGDEIVSPMSPAYSPANPILSPLEDDAPGSRSDSA
jgi:hypothetical protein